MVRECCLRIISALAAKDVDSDRKRAMPEVACEYPDECLGNDVADGT